MQYVTLHSDLKTVKDKIEKNKTKQKDLFDTRLSAYTMLTLDKKLKEESKIELRMNQLEGRVGKVDEKLQLLVNQDVQTNKFLLKLLEAQNSNPTDKKRGRRMSLLRKPQDNQSTEVQTQTAGLSNPNTEEAIKLPNRKRTSTQTQRHQERKKKKLSAEERRREREAVMIL